MKYVSDKGAVSRNLTVLLYIYVYSQLLLEADLQKMNQIYPAFNSSLILFIVCQWKVIKFVLKREYNAAFGMVHR